MTQIEKLQELIDSSRNIVVFTGAGISTESGIPDFRSESGIFNTIKNYGYPPEVLLSHSFFIKNTEVFFKYYKENFIVTDVEPNIAHKTIAALEKSGKVKAVITQNVDGLHTKAGTKNIFELHGSIYRNYCMKCRKFHSVDFIKKAKGIPYCECGGIVKPHVVLYEEGLSDRTLNGAANAVADADMLIVCGTSLVVYPAAGLVPLYEGDKLVIINKSQTPADEMANLVLHESLGDVFSKIEF